MQPIHIDVTELLANSLHTGIQRVVRQIAKRGIAANPGGVIPVIASDGQFHALNAAGIDLLCGPSGQAGGARLTEGGITARAAKYVLGWLPPLYDRAQSAYFRQKMKVHLDGMFDPVPINFQAGARLALLDSFWGGSTTLRAARVAHSAGCAIVAVVYDMIPVTHSDFASVHLARAFPPAIFGAARICAGFVTISKYCQDVIQEFLLEHRLSLPVAVFYLGADLVREADGANNLTFPIESGDGHGRLYLMVGTIEPRKSHAVVLEAFERLWQQGRQDSLLIIGKVGWDVDPLMARLNAHPELGKRLHLMHNANDTMLAQAFDRADAAIMASSVEGFGLPLVEALSRKLPVIASDIPVFREIAGNPALYFNQGDAADLARAIVTMESDAAIYRSAAAAFVWIDWDAAAKQFLVAVDDVLTRSAATGVQP